MVCTDEVPLWCAEKTEIRETKKAESHEIRQKQKSRLQSRSTTQCMKQIKAERHKLIHEKRKRLLCLNAEGCAWDAQQEFPGSRRRRLVADVRLSQEAAEVGPLLPPSAYAQWHLGSAYSNILSGRASQRH